MNAQTIFERPNPKKEKKKFSEETHKLIVKHQEIFQPKHPGGAVIHVDEIASKVASLYEKIRGIVDWKEEHLIRRTAIERALKRRLISELSGINLAADLEPEKMAEPLVLELTRGGHFPNDAIPKARLAGIQKTLYKYVYILKNNPLTKQTSAGKIKIKINFYNWILEIAACEIEEILDPPEKEDALIEYMTNLMNQRIRVYPEGVMTEAEKRLQTYISVHRTLFRLDNPIISYRLIKYRYPLWANPTESFLKEAAQNILSIWQLIKKDLNYPLTNDFYRICEKYDTLYLILGDLLKSYSAKPAEIPGAFADSKQLGAQVNRFYFQRLSTLRKRLFRMAVFSTLSVFVASGFSLFIVEVPIAKYFYGEFKPLAIVVDLALPTVLMFILIALVRMPGKNNLKKVREEISKIVYPQEKLDVYDIRTDKKRSWFTASMITFLYTLGSLLSLALIFWVFHVTRVPPTSVYIDTLNVAVIVFAALIVRQRAKELAVEDRATFWEFFIDTLSVPLARVGQWLANKWREYNIVSVFFTILVDMPFMTLVEFVEDWSSFIKDKKSQLH